MKFEKKFISIDEQLILLKKRGLEIPNEKEARNLLYHINYYHFSSYFKAFQDENDNFVENISFDKVFNVYKFDKKLRILLLDLLEIIEMSFKSVLAYDITKKKDDICWYSREDNITDSDTYNKFLENIKKSKESYILNFYEKYNENEYPPAWMFFESLSFGECRYFANYLNDCDKNIIGSKYALSRRDSVQVFYHLARLRNICAHHSRLWNRKFDANTPVIKKYKSLFTEKRNTLFDYLILLQIVLTKIIYNSNWLDKLSDLVDYYEISIERMGFPTNWKELLIAINNKNKYE